MLVCGCDVFAVMEHPVVMVVVVVVVAVVVVSIVVCSDCSRIPNPSTMDPRHLRPLSCSRRIHPHLRCAHPHLRCRDPLDEKK